MADQGWFNYVVSFSDRRAKTGVTSKPFHRLQDFAQEATRRGVKVDGFKITAPAKTKALALTVEASVCKQFADQSIPGHREWFYDDLEWCGRSKKLRKLFGRGVYPGLECTMEVAWMDAHASGAWAHTRFEAPRYNQVREFAEELGKGGARISAVRAARMAETLVAPLSALGERMLGRLSI